MPLITKLFPALERVHDDSNPRALNASSEERQFDESYNNFEQREEDDMSDGSMIHRPRPKKRTSTKTPTVPPRSQLRASRIFESLTIELKALERAALGKELERQSVESDPYASYVSSEEDASESADEYDESIIELDCDRPFSSGASSRHSHEDTARVVSFMFVGKPQLVDVVSHSPPTSLKRRSTDLTEDSARRRPTPIRLIPSLSRGSTRTSSLPQSQSTISLPLRQYNNPSSHSLASRASKTSKHSFLDTDPFSSHETQDTQVSLPAQPSDVAPKTPTSIVEGMRSVSRTIGMAAKKRSMPKLSLSYAPGVVKPLGDTPTPSSTTTSSATTATPSTATMTPLQDQGLLRYEDIMKNVIRAPPAMSPKSPKHKPKGSVLGFGGIGIGMGLGRRKSIKG